MIGFIRKWLDRRWTNQRFGEIQAQTRRSSTKLSPAYEKRRVREIRAAQAMFNGGAQ